MSKETPKEHTSPLGPEYNEIIKKLIECKTGYERNAYLNSIEFEKINAQLILSKQILEIEHEIKKNQIKLNEVIKIKLLFDYYNDGEDRY